MKKKNGTKGNANICARNKKAFYDFFILDSFETGIVLQGSEVKSIREHRLNIKDSYGRINRGELFIYNMHISPYGKSRIEDIDPRRTRKLLLHRRQINKLMGKLTDNSLTLVPLKVYLKRNIVKVGLALAKGKVKRDKRRDIQDKEHDREMKRALKNY